jgi:V/A-type H+/Na+-transporting ATPase subunit E
MALSDLLEGLKAEAAAEDARLDAETRAEAARIDAEAREQARILQEEALRAVEDEVRGAADTQLAGARLSAVAAVRQAGEDAFREFVADVRGKLDGIRDSPGYPALLRALLRESLTALPAADVLRVDPRDERLAADLLAELGAAVEIAGTLETAGGLELARGEDRVVRNTVEERFANAEPALRVLFGRSQPGKDS